MAGLRVILDQMADQIRATLGAAANTVDMQVEPRPVLSPTPLTIDMLPGSPLHDRASAAFGDSGGYLVTVRAYINAPDADGAWDILVSLMDDEDDLCLIQALLDDPTLNGNATDVDVPLESITGLILIQALDGGNYLGFQFTAIVLPAHS